MYGTTTEAQTHWTNRGYTGAPTQTNLIRASHFIDSLGWATIAGRPVSMFPGLPSVPEQEYQWPRVGASDVYGRDLPDDKVPGGVIRATYEAAYYELQSPGSLNAAQRADQVVKSEKFGEVSFEYAIEATQGQLSLTAPVIPAVMTYLAPYLVGGSNPFGITGVVA